MTVIASILLWIGILTLSFGIYFCIIGSRKINYNIRIERENKILEDKKQQLLNEIEQLKNSKAETLNEQKAAIENYCDILDLNYNSKENEYDIKINNLQQSYKLNLDNAKLEFYHSFEQYINNLDEVYNSKEKEYDTKINNLQLDYKEALWKEKNQFQKAFERYTENLDSSYIEAEKEYDAAITKIQSSIENYKAELEKIQNTYSAAIQARLREEEMKQKLDYYCLHLTSAEESTIALIEELKPRLPEPRVLCMLVWQTFYQKQLKSLCANVLGNKVVTGIYKITNKIAGQCYIGQAVDCAKRFSEHVKAGLGIDTPPQNKLYKAMLKDGIVNFTFELLEECPKEQLDEKEKFYINLYQTYDYGYNSNIGNSK